MKNLSKLLLLSIIISVFTFYSCTKTSSNFNIIPENATMVMVFDGKSLSEKSGYESFADSKTYQFIKSDVPEDEMENFMILDPIFKNTAESGLNLKSDYFAFNYKRGEISYMALVMNIIDKSKFEATMTKINEVEEANFEIQSDDKWNYIFEENGSSPLIIWDETKIMVLFSTDGSQSKDVYLAESKLLWDQKSDKSIGSNKDFQKFEQNRKDMSVWMDYSIFFDNLPPMQKMMVQSNMPFDMSGTMLHFYADFQKGKAVFSYDVKMNDEMQSFMKENKLIKDKFDMAILEALPQKSYANFSMAFDLLAYFEIFKDGMEQNQQSIDKIDQQFKETVGMTIKEALNEFSGEIVFNVHKIGIKEVEKTDYRSYYESDGEKDISEFKIMAKQPVIYYSVAAEMNNDKFFNILIEKFTNQVEKIDGYYAMASMDTYFGLFGKKLIFTNDKDLIIDAADGQIEGASLATSEIADNLKDFPTYAFVDLDLDMYPAEIREALKEMMGEEEYNSFTNIISAYKKLEVKPKSINEAEVVLWMKDESKNSLEVMLKGFDSNIEAIVD